MTGRLEWLTGFRLEPVPGLVPTRTFYGALAERRFLSTQYMRHHSVPFYTPEPDIVHELVGHANMLASPMFAALYQAAGQASRRARTDAALEFFSRVFWFTLEFGVAVGTRRAARVRRRPAVVVRRARGVPRRARRARSTSSRWAPPTTTSRSTSRSSSPASSFNEIVDVVGAFFESFDDEPAEKLARPRGRLRDRAA